MTLEELQDRTLDVIKKTKKQLHRPHWSSDGLTDKEFASRILDTLSRDIKTAKLLRKRRGYRHPCSLCGHTPED